MSKPWMKQKELDEHRYWNHTGEQDKNFFKVMIGDFHERMIIPDKFAQHFRGQIGRTIKLASRHGYTSDVQITKNLAKLVLDSGWKAFARAHNLRTGDFLVFKYDGNSELKVLIFGPSGCEKIPACNLMKNAAPAKEWLATPVSSYRYVSHEISRKYAEVYLPFVEQMVTLQHHGKKWEVRCCVKNKKSKRLMRGWMHFVRGNNLQLGDVCLFELLRNKKKYVMNVHIIRKSL
ncbi:unnamed protein product [Triticum turgidum subsp. durum]|uniref:TF-B3 domain-containing protein n=1 Tax=Triticum turgidum subsp. durum TaxID=4567 RepID=A0A9R0VTM9_TRITD|nr:unnamed protein product [Triticum turgidum subsp. durum]